MNLLTQIAKKPQLDFIFNYKIPYGRDNNFCRVRYYSDPQHQVLIMTELKNSGMSVTNSVEHIVSQLKDYFLRQEGIRIKDNCLFIEHYEKEFYNNSYPEEFSLIKFDADNKPDWSVLSEDNIRNILVEKLQ